MSGLGVLAAHDSRLLPFRRPFGAVKEGEKIELNIECGKSVVSAGLRVWMEGRERVEQGTRTDTGFTFCHTAGRRGLEWYYFLIETESGNYILGSESPLGCGKSRLFTHDPNSWQISVYDKDFKAPDDARGAMAYQIFPDRFNRTGLGGLNRLSRREELNWRTIRHDNWDEPVLWQALPGEKDYDPVDFYGGDFEGIEAKLDYLESVGVTVIYMNPIFEAQSNHRYNTGDYHRVDEMLGGEDGLKRLISACRERGIKLMLDGVFSHTGDESVYFNKSGAYPGLGAYQGKDSAYYDWYEFDSFPDKYGCWWGFKTLPEVNEKNRGYMAFIAGVIEHYSRLGIASWRLDVADELPDEFIAFLRRELKARQKEGILIGEVWEDASTKTGGEGRRKYTDGLELDGVTNYVFANAVISFLSGKSDAYALSLSLTALRQNYPEAFYLSCLNVLSTHDTVRTLTVLCGAPDRHTPRDTQAAFAPGAEELERAKLLMSMAELIQLSHPGIPCVYYGDEAGMQGMADPFCRGAYPWGREDEGIKSRFIKMAEARKQSRAMRLGKCAFAAPDKDIFIIARFIGDELTISLVNRSNEAKTIEIGENTFTEGPDIQGLIIKESMVDALSGREYRKKGEKIGLELPPYGMALLK